MKIKVNSKDLLTELVKVAVVVKSTNVLPILDYIDFRFKEEGIELQASDMETTVKALLTDIESVSSSVGERVAVKSKTLLSLLKSLKNETVSLTFGNNELKLKASTGTYKIPTTNDEFPEPMIEEFNGSFTLPGHVLSSAINRTEGFVSQDTLKPSLTGVCFDIKEDGITFIATDGRRLAKCKTNIGATELKLMVPTTPLDSLKGLKNSAVKIHYNNTNVMFTFDNVTVIGRLIDGRYPPYEQVIPTEFCCSFEVGKAEFMESVKRVDIFANDASKEIILDFKDNNLHVSASDNNWATSANEDLPVKTTGELRIAFAGNILLDVLNNSTDGTLLFEFVGSIKPAIVTNSASPELLNLLMPIAL